jgi:hypothetical protein
LCIANLKKCINGIIILSFEFGKSEEDKFIESCLLDLKNIKVEIAKMNKLFRPSETTRTKNRNIELSFDISGIPLKEWAMIESYVRDPDAKWKFIGSNEELRLILT